MLLTRGYAGAHPGLSASPQSARRHMLRMTSYLVSQFPVLRCRRVPAARMCHRRWQTMHNRWQAHKGAACGEVAPIIMCLEVAQHCSTSSTPNDSEVSSSPQVSLTLHQRLSMVKHLRRLLYFPVLRNLRERRHDHRVLLGVLPYPLQLMIVSI